MWIYEKFIGDIAVYGICPKCGFSFAANKGDPFSNPPVITVKYNYCPNCGKKHKTKKAAKIIIDEKTYQTWVNEMKG